jgi:hypothetical protein
MSTPRALVSVSDKSGLAPFVQGLQELGFEILSTGGTSAFLREQGEPAYVEEVTEAEDDDPAGGAGALPGLLGGNTDAQIRALYAYLSDGAKAVETSSDPVQLYRSFLEYTLRSRWQRPEGLEDAAFVAEVELQVGRRGEVLGSRWLKGSGNAAWDQSVRRALDTTPRVDRVPPKGFPETVRVRFDVVQEADADAIAVP